MLWLQLLSTLSEDERDFVTRIYEEYGDEMYSSALNILKNPKDAEYAVSDIMYTIILNLSKYEGQSDEAIRNQIVIYIRSIIRNISINAYIKRKRTWSREASTYWINEETGEQEEKEFADESFNLEEWVIDKNEVERAKLALLSLSEPLQDAVNLVCLCGYNSMEAARVLKINPGTVRARIFQARKKLRELMEETENVQR